MDSQQIPKSHKEALAPHVADGETVKAVHTWPMEDLPKSETVAVTNRRFFRITKGEERESGREFEIVESIPLEKVTRAKMVVRGEEPVQWIEVLVGAIIAVLGIPIFLWAADQPDPVDLFGVLGAFVVFIIGLVILGNAYDTDDGGVDLRLRTADGEKRSVKLPEDRTDFAATAINEVEN